MRGSKHEEKIGAIALRQIGVYAGRLPRPPVQPSKPPLGRPRCGLRLLSRGRGSMVQTRSKMVNRIMGEMVDLVCGPPGPACSASPRNQSKRREAGIRKEPSGFHPASFIFWSLRDKSQCKMMALHKTHIENFFDGSVGMVAVPSRCFSVGSGVLVVAPFPPRSVAQKLLPHPAPLRYAPPLRSGSCGGFASLTPRSSLSLLPLRRGYGSRPGHRQARRKGG